MGPLACDWNLVKRLMQDRAFRAQRGYPGRETALQPCSCRIDAHVQVQAETYMHACVYTCMHIQKFMCTQIRDASNVLYIYHYNTRVCACTMLQVHELPCLRKLCMAPCGHFPGGETCWQSRACHRSIVMVQEQQQQHQYSSVIHIIVVYTVYSSIRVYIQYSGIYSIQFSSSTAQYSGKVQYIHVYIVTQQ